MLEFKVAIPARYGSSRLPGKPLRLLAGKPMLYYVVSHALESGAQEVVIATDDERIAGVVEDFGARVCMTSPRHTSGSDRLAEAGTLLGWDDATVLVNLQGDEPMMPAVNIRQVAENLSRHTQASLTTLCVPIERWEEFNNPNVVKVVRNKENVALYFSRAPIPVERDDASGDKFSIPRACYRHIGLYAYRFGYLKTYAQTPPCMLETLERLEQLRALWQGHSIHVADALQLPGPGVDTLEDLATVEKLLTRADGVL